ncbi:MAG: hypothetical protein Q9M27_06945 [Mariprofundaceae bacterium]|nr:hypothetical protein [Mariprofundaceae bacterium]
MPNVFFRAVRHLSAIKTNNFLSATSSLEMLFDAGLKVKGVACSEAV